MTTRLQSSRLMLAGLLALPVLPPLHLAGRAESLPPAEASQPLAETASGAPAAAAPPAWALDDSRHDAIEFSAGTFTPAEYGPLPGVGWCSALTLCSEDPLFGSVFSLTYVRRLRHHNQRNLDLDVTGYVGTQSVDGPTRTFGMLAIVPTYRIRLPGKLSFLTAGVGLGLNASIGDMPSEDPNVPINSQLNFELALTPRADSKFELTFALEHRCTFFGLLNTVDGSLSGSQWYTVGLRKWF